MKETTLRRWLIPVLSFLSLLIFLFLWSQIEYHELSGFWWDLLKRFFEAGVIAMILALTVDVFLKKEFGRDVFLASIGYVLPEELRPEMRWVTGLEDFCTEDTMRCTLSLVGKDCVKFDVYRKQVLKNIGASARDVPVGLGIDEWFREEGTSRIKKFTILQTGHSWPPDGQLTKEHIGKLDFGLNVAPGISTLTLQKEEEVTIISEFEEFYPRNGYFHMHIKYPTSGATVTVDCPDDIGLYVHFAHREGKETLKSGQNYECPFTLLPYQRIGIRFWDKLKSEEWKRQPVTLEGR